MRCWSKKAAALALTGALVLAASARAEGWGTIKGQVVWGGGDVPKPVELKVDKDKEHCLSKGPILKEEYVVNPKNKGVRWAAVYLTSADGFAKDVPVHPKLKEIKDKTVSIDQPCCRFEPHVLAMREGQELLVKNSAPIAHNVNIQGGTKGPNLNQILPPGGALRVTPDQLQPRALPISVSCNIHGWMTGKVFVLKNPYFAVTDEDGKFEIKDAPAGDYRVVVWHEGMGWVVGDKAPNRMGKKITVKDGEATDLGEIPVKPSND